MTRDRALVLAAGKGTRMHSKLPKVIQPLAGRPMLARVLRALTDAGFERPTVVIGYEADLVKSTIGDCCEWVIQSEQNGTADAVRVGLEALPPATERLLVCHGDEPLLEGQTYREMLQLQQDSGAPVVLLTTEVQDTRGFGRLIRDSGGRPAALYQESELEPDQRHLTEVNLGAYVFDAGFLRRSLPTLRPHKPKNEYFLTDLVALAVKEGTNYKVPVATMSIDGGERVMGINDLVQLEEAGRQLYRQQAERLMHAGIRILDVASTFVDEDVQIDPDTMLHPFTIIRGCTRIGSGCEVGPGSCIESSEIGQRCHILSSTLTDAVVGDDVHIGPYAHLREGAKVASGAWIGNYAEIKKSSLGSGTQMHHFSYVGDAQVGDEVNIGAGTVTVNYDGVAKHETVIEDRAFIGSDTMLRAPVRIGEGASTGAGSVVIRDVAPGTVVAGVPAQELKPKSSRGKPRAEHDGSTDGRKRRR